MVTVEEWLSIGFFGGVGVATLLMWFVSRDWSRRIAWVGVGVFGLLAAGIAVLYLIGIPILLLTIFWGAAFRLRTLLRYAPALAVLLVLVLVLGIELVLAAFDVVQLSDELPGGMLLGSSAVAALAAAVKLGQRCWRLFQLSPRTQSPA
jgi:hypothetical protein